MGGREGAMMNSGFDKMVDLLKDLNHTSDNLIAKTNPEGEHNEEFWDLEFKAAIIWLSSR
jgi:hypothetical protein